MLTFSPFGGFIDSETVVGVDVVAESSRTFGATGSGRVTVPGATFGTEFWRAEQALERSVYAGNDRVATVPSSRWEPVDAVGGLDWPLPPGRELRDFTVRVRSVSPMTQMES